MLIASACVSMPVAPPADSSAPFVEATHAAPLAIPFGGGATLASPKIAVVTFAGYSFADSIEAMADYVPTSAWLGAVSAEYGAGTPSEIGRASCRERV